jgi:hypothetical protein
MLRVLDRFSIRYVSQRYFIKDGDAAPERWGALVDWDTNEIVVSVSSRLEETVESVIAAVEIAVVGMIESGDRSTPACDSPRFLGGIDPSS